MFGLDEGSFTTHSYFSSFFNVSMPLAVHFKTDNANRLFGAL